VLAIARIYEPVVSARDAVYRLHLIGKICLWVNARFLFIGRRIAVRAPVTFELTCLGIIDDNTMIDVSIGDISFLTSIIKSNLRCLGDLRDIQAAFSCAWSSQL